MRTVRRYLKRRTTHLNLAAMRILWPVVVRLSLERSPWARYVQANVRARRARHGFDVAWLRVVLSVLALPAFLIVLPFHPALVTAGTIAALLFGALLTAYFGHLLARRLQCGLLEWCTIVVVLGNLEGLAFTTPRVMSSPAFPVLLGLTVASMVSYGAVVGLVEIRMLGLSHPFARVGVMVASWWRLASVPLILGGCFLAFEEHLPSRGNLVGPELAAWGLAFVAAGMAGLLVSLFIRRRTRCVSWLALNSWPTQMVTGSSHHRAH